MLWRLTAFVAIFVVAPAIQSTCAAQPQTAPTQIRPILAVLEFHDFSDHRGHMVGRRVTERLQSALSASARWSVLDADVVAAAVEEMGIAPPFAVGYQQALAHRLGADLTVTGRIDRVDTRTHGRVSVGLVVDFVERVAGQSVMPMTVQGTSAPSDTPAPTDVHLDSAIADACRQVSAMATTATDAQAIVTRIKGKSIELKPTDDRILRIDDRVLIYRLRASGDRRPEPLGVALITSSNDEKAAGTLLAKDRDVYTDDIAVCIGPARASEQE